MSLKVRTLKGTGSPLLMMHGWGRSHENLLSLGELLKAHSAPVLLDLPGFGNSPRPGDVWGSFDYANFIIEQIPDEKIDILGHSFGGKIALSMAIKYPERVGKLILIATSGFQKKRPLLKKARFHLIKITGTALKFWDQVSGTNLFQERFAPRFASSDYKNAGDMRPILIKSINEDLSSFLPRIKCKTLLLWGERDEITPIDIGKKLERHIANAKLISFPYLGHDIVEGTSAHLLARYIRPFLEGC